MVLKSNNYNLYIKHNSIKYIHNEYAFSNLSNVYKCNLAILYDICINNAFILCSQSYDTNIPLIYKIVPYN